jgi:hypothetical protein
MLTFIIPVCHPHNAKDWNRLKRELSQTILSISSQKCEDWNAVIVANEGSDLPSLPARFDVRWVDFPPNDLYEQGNAERELFYDAFRLDKGRRVLAGMLHAGKTGHMMVVDADDFVSNQLAAFVAYHPGHVGWYLANGYMWTDGGRLLYVSPDFHKLCGTSHIIRADLYGLPGQLKHVSDSHVRNLLGSHIFVDTYLKDSGTPLSPLPFVGAVYRVGHISAHSKSKGILSQLFLDKKLMAHPFRLLKRTLRLRFVNESLQQEFSLRP